MPSALAPSFSEPVRISSDSGHWEFPFGQPSASEKSSSLRSDPVVPDDDALADLLRSLAFGTSQVMVTEPVDSDLDRRAC